MQEFTREKEFTPLNQLPSGMTHVVPVRIPELWTNRDLVKNACMTRQRRLTDLGYTVEKVEEIGPCKLDNGPDVWSWFIYVRKEE